MSFDLKTAHADHDAHCRCAFDHGVMECEEKAALDEIERLHLENTHLRYHLGSKQAFLDQHHEAVDADLCEKCGDRHTDPYPSSLGEVYEAVRFLDAMRVPADVGNLAARIAWMVDNDTWGEDGAVMAAQQAMRVAEAERDEYAEAVRQFADAAKKLFAHEGHLGVTPAFDAALALPVTQKLREET